MLCQSGFLHTTAQDIKLLNTVLKAVYSEYDELMQMAENLSDAFTKLSKGTERLLVYRDVQAKIKESYKSRFYMEERTLTEEVGKLVEEKLESYFSFECEEPCASISRTGIGKGLRAVEMPDAEVAKIVKHCNDIEECAATILKLPPCIGKHLWAQ